MQNGQKKSNNKKEGVGRIRMTVVFLLVMLFGALCIGQICYLSFFEGSVCMGKSDKCVDMTQEGWESKDYPECQCYIKANTITSERGEILDDRGRLLVGNYTVFEIAFDGNKFSREYDNGKYSSEEVESLLKNLAQSFYQQFKDRSKKTEKEYYKTFKTSYKNKRYVCVLPVKIWEEKSWVTSRDTAYIHSLDFLTRKVMDKETQTYKKIKYYGYLNCVPTSVRVNPYGDMARRTLGMNIEGHKYGLEYAMDSILAGVQGSKKYLELNKANVPLKNQVDPIDGHNIYTTLNLEIQNIVHNELHRKLVELGAEWGCAIVMETKTGEVKAISNLYRTSPNCESYSESMEYALNAKVEPGSTFKLASLLAFFEKGMTDTAQIYPIYNHTFEYPLKNGSVRRYTKSDSKVHGEGLARPNEIFQRSSNIGISSMIFKAYGKRGFESYRQQLKKFGFFDTIQTQLGPLMPASIRNDGRFDNYYAVCFGAGFSIPVLRTLMYYNAIANDGKMMKPFFVKHITNEFDTIKTFEPEVVMDSMVSDYTLRKARAYLDSVVWGRYGTGRRYKDSTCPFAGKTGTRDIWDQTLGAYNYDRNAVSFCGYFPKDNPKYTAIVYIYDIVPHSEVAVDLFGKIARGIMNIHGYGAIHSITEYPKIPLANTRPVNRRYFNSLLSKIGYDTVAYDASSKYLMLQQDRKTKEVQVQSLPVRKLEKAPDVRDMIASDAVAELTRAGYKVALHGRGRVKIQTLDPSTHLVKLYLEP